MYFRSILQPGMLYDFEMFIILNYIYILILIIKDRDVINSVKNQGVWEICWAFAGIEAIDDLVSGSIL